MANIVDAIDDVANNVPNAPAASSASRYRYRDADKRRAYMCALMRRRRRTELRQAKDPS